MQNSTTFVQVENENQLIIPLSFSLLLAFTTSQKPKRDYSSWMFVPTRYELVIKLDVNLTNFEIILTQIKAIQVYFIKYNGQTSSIKIRSICSKKESENESLKSLILAKTMQSSGNTHYPW